MKTYDMKAIFAFMTVLALIVSATSIVAAQSLFDVEAVDLIVYRDGLVHVKQTLTIDELAPEITLRLLSSSIENVIVLDESQLSVDYEIDGENLTVFTLGAKRVSVEYDTISLTSKEAEVWTLIVNTPFILTVFLPQNSTVIYLNMMPTAIDTSGTRIKLSLYPSQWEISYVLPLTSDDGADGNGTSYNAIPIEYLILAIVAVVVLVILALLIIRHRSGPNVEKTVKAYPQLKKEDKDVIEFIAEKGGHVFEAEIRERFPDMPRTSLWRLVRRLERMEIVEVKKIGLENQVQLRK
jgi:uncharacterized membrane protein